MYIYFVCHINFGFNFVKNQGRQVSRTFFFFIPVLAAERQNSLMDLQLAV